jgi:phospholipase/carboxylesterase
MTEQHNQSVALWPESRQPQQLFILLHGVGAQAADLLPLAERLQEEFAQAAFFLPDAPMPFDGGGSGHQWYSNRGISEDNRPLRVAEALPAVHDLVTHAQQHFNVLPAATALVGFSQGAIMALHLAVLHDGLVGRVLAFSGRFAALPDKAPQLTTLHLLHGEADSVIAHSHSQLAHEHLKHIDGDVTLDVLAEVGHEINAQMAERAIYRLKNSIPLRSWKQAMQSQG